MEEMLRDFDTGEMVNSLDSDSSVMKVTMKSLCAGSWPSRYLTGTGNDTHMI